MNAKEYLAQARELDALIDTKLDQIAKMRATMTRCTHTLSGMPGGGKRTDWTDTAARVYELEEAMNGDIDRLTALKREIGETIDRLSDPTQRALLHGRYLGGWSWTKTARVIGYSVDGTFKIHRHALKKVDEILKSGSNGQ